MPYVATTLAVVALFADVASLRGKETERMIAICTELRKPSTHTTITEWPWPFHLLPLLMLLLLFEIQAALEKRSLIISMFSLILPRTEWSFYVMTKDGARNMALLGLEF